MHVILSINKKYMNMNNNKNIRIIQTFWGGGQLYIPCTWESWYTYWLYRRLGVGD